MIKMEKNGTSAEDARDIYDWAGDALTDWLDSEETHASPMPSPGLP